jgi:hypothetical protein
MQVTKYILFRIKVLFTFSKDLLKKIKRAKEKHNINDYK